ncbi:PREDICTED: uncharacterized protein LOC109166477 [Ipomoea nil]|uniref:uncharacterized protein LOC109166477 n=1 Tax=Ipomoea nil TaxID=35883 RepID=UPI000900997E|nr:PREDICTED: uncharacterized protein LOC109166477 [Ipomoea nil]
MYVGNVALQPVQEEEEHYMVGRILTDKAIKFMFFRDTMTNVWRPSFGMNIKELQPRKFLFRFYREKDISRILEDGPWAYEQSLLILKRISVAEDPETVVLDRAEFWIQVHGLPNGLRSEAVLSAVGGYIGRVTKLDDRNFDGSMRLFFRVRVEIEVAKPLKKGMWLKKDNGEWAKVDFRYERLPTFCFICGLLGHGDKFCHKDSPVVKPYGPDLRAGGRRNIPADGLRWIAPETTQERRQWVPPGRSETENEKGKNPIITPDDSLAISITEPLHGNVVPSKEILDIQNNSTQNVCMDNYDDSITIMDPKRRRTESEEENKSGPIVPMDFEQMKEALEVGWPCYGVTGIANLISFSSNHIDVEVRLPGSEPWRLTCFYGYPERNRRQQSWDLLRSLKTKSDLPWLVAGDFNDLTSQSEKRGIHPHPNSLLEGFTQALEDCSLFDIGMRGRRFTWERWKGTSDWVEERLDRAVAVAEWCTLFPQATVYNHEVITSDHTAIYIELEGPRISRQQRRFLFENAWLKEIGCKDVVLNSWYATMGDAIPSRLNHCGEVLRRWGGNYAKRLQTEIQYIQHRLVGLRDRRDTQSLSLFRELDERMRALFDQLNVFWRQRAKQHWLRHGDRNTRFFHLYASARKRKNRIAKLLDENNQWVEEDGLLNLAARYYQNIFTTKGVQFDAALDDLAMKVSDEDNHNLMRHFTIEEVKDALFSMAPDKSPGPDGYSPAFYQFFWNEIGQDVAEFVIDCAMSDSFSLGFNDAYITLIPKKKSPINMGELRPIALCNVTYKILSKMIANRLKPILQRIVSVTQSAFLLDRLITDNVIVASEVIHYLNRKREGKDGWCALKLDMAKAYDKMEWEFLEYILSRLGFHAHWIKLIMRCVSTVRYKVAMNGVLTDFIVPSCGLRQGDPLSPYLFILCAEGLSHLISGAVNRNLISPCVVARRAPGVSHLFFADDSLLFFKAKVEEAGTVKHCLLNYERMSGQHVNFDKSCVVFSRNTNETVRTQVAAVLSVNQAGDIGKYLGLPMGVGRNKKEVFSYIEEKLKQRLSGWNKKVLSRAGKEVLLKSVAQALPTYTMSVYILPITFCERIERMMNKFLWDSGGQGGGIRWLSWSRMCIPKKEGGLGFKSLRNFNIALLAKQGWRLLTNPSSLAARLLKARYFPNGDFLTTTIGANPSFCWRSILAGQEVLRKGCFRRIGNGISTRVWDQPWLPDANDPFVHSPIQQHDPTLKVSDLMIPGSNSWNVTLLDHIFIPRDVDLILKIPIANQFEDNWCCRGDLRGMYSVRLGYRLLSTVHENIEPVWCDIWKLKLPPKALNFIWRCVHCIIPTRVALHNRRVDLDTMCPLCNLQPETLKHLFCQCIHTVSLWQNIADCNLPNDDMTFVVWLSAYLRDGNVQKVCSITALCWCLWQARNNLVWNNKPWQTDQIWLEYQRVAAEWLQMGDADSVEGGSTGFSHGINMTVQADVY